MVEHRPEANKTTALGAPIWGRDKLTEAQSRMRSAQIARTAGTIIGLGTGCLLGLTPLLFFDNPPAHGA